MSPAGLLVLWPGAWVGTWGPQVGIPSWGVGSFLGLVVRVGAPGISGQVLQMLGAVSGPLAPPGLLPWGLILTGRAGLGQERGFVLSI